MYSAICKFRLQKESAAAIRNAPSLLAPPLSPICSATQPAEQPIIHDQASRASLIALRLIALYVACDFFILSLYLSSKIYIYFYQHDPPITYALEFIAGSFISLQIVWICLLFRAFSAIAVGDRAPRVVRTKSLQASKSNPRSPGPTLSELAFSEAKTNIIMRSC